MITRRRFLQGLVVFVTILAGCGTPPPMANFLQLENGVNYLLQEDGVSRIILDENAVLVTPTIRGSAISYAPTTFALQGRIRL